METGEIFNEQSLRADIVKQWGEHGAHIDIFDMMLKRVVYRKYNKSKHKRALIYFNEQHIDKSRIISMYKREDIIFPYIKFHYQLLCWTKSFPFIKFRTFRYGGSKRFKELFEYKKMYCVVVEMDNGKKIKKYIPRGVYGSVTLAEGELSDLIRNYEKTD